VRYSVVIAESVPTRVERGGRGVRPVNLRVCKTLHEMYPRTGRSGVRGWEACGGWVQLDYRAVREITDAAVCVLGHYLAPKPSHWARKRRPLPNRRAAAIELVVPSLNFQRCRNQRTKTKTRKCRHVDERTPPGPRTHRSPAHVILNVRGLRARLVSSHVKSKDRALKVFRTIFTKWRTTSTTSTISRTSYAILSWAFGS